MKDTKYIIIFVVIGLALAFAVSGPLRRPPQSLPLVGTPLNAGGSTVATSNQPPVADSQVYAEGTISLDPSLTSKVAGRSLFIMAKASAGGKPAGGPPIAVQRIDAPGFPLPFALRTDNNMVGSEFFAGDLFVTVRLDKDGVAGPKQPEDYEASTEVKNTSTRQIQLTIQP